MSEENMEWVAEIFKVLSNEIRLKILLSISRKEKCVHDLSEELNMSYSSISHHLRKLKDKKMIKKRKEGKHRYYRLKDRNIEKIIERGIKYVSKSS